MNCNTQNAKIADVDEKTLVVVIDVGSEYHYYEGSKPDIPTLMFVSDGKVMQQVYGDDCTSIWRSIHKDYIESLSYGVIIELDCGHYLHAEKPDLVAAEIVAFIDSLG